MTHKASHDKWEQLKIRELIDMVIMQSLSFMCFISALWFYQSDIKMQFT